AEHDRHRDHGLVRHECAHLRPLQAGEGGDEVEIPAQRGPIHGAQHTGFGAGAARACGRRAAWRWRRRRDRMTRTGGAFMKEKEQIVENWLPRYTGVPLDGFGEHILLTNFGGYLDHFARLSGAQIVGTDRPMPSATADGITMINFGMGSPNAATMMDLLSAIAPRAVLFLGKCGGLKKKNRLGDLILPIAAIRGEGTSNDYLLPQVPALPAFALQRAVST